MRIQELRYYILFKPFGYLSQFSDEGGNPGLGQLLKVEKDIYPVGRLDKDSEGLLLLTNDKTLNNRLLNPNKNHERSYLVQVEKEINQEAIEQLKKGVNIKVGKKRYDTLTCKARLLSDNDLPDLPERHPPVRFRKSVPTSWFEIKLFEGKNRQVRKMCAAVGFPCLRLLRLAIEELTLQGLSPGEIKEINGPELHKHLKIKLS